ncbi:MATH domain and coiled-coil domain-containing protein At3g58270-like [Trifolium pratense]|uniref:MATH domain and coiled-coil domain-containing protein At3g58270-like n=1 Tax=Trifolium pratense TaxID=57577 RepID=UPI001E693021|nr:MATH domain and coiled-coil domain-containing protein At3g58270-like [Trifolium pratense]XP_045795793.1 MATH domain and coiled-coil domain-containing protein At3g58270-like [Trifolium pratense]
MESQVSSTKIFEKFTWKIENFSRLNVDKMYSDPFILCGYPWRILLFPKGNKTKGAVDHLSIYLEAVKTEYASEGWIRDVKFKLVVFNQLDSNMTIISETTHKFKANESNYGYLSFMKLSQLRNPKKGFIVKDVCIVGAEVFVCKTFEKPVNQAAELTVSLASGSQNGHVKVDVPIPNPEVQGPTMEVCSDDPPSIERPRKRSRKFTDLAFAVLGRILYFLRTKKVKDMDEQACKELQVLWNELKKFKFDLTWLEPQVQCALGMKSFVEKALQVEKLKENIEAIELETGRLKAKLAAAEVNLNVERDLLKAKGIKERDLDSELGSGSWKP